MAGFQDPLWRAFSRLFLLLSFLVSRLMLTTAQPATLQFSDCFSSSNTSQKLDVSAVYAQFFPASSKGAYINFTVIGTSPQEIIAASNGTNPVASTSQSSVLRDTSMMGVHTTSSDSIYYYRGTHLPATQPPRRLVLLRDLASCIPPQHARS